MLRKLAKANESKARINPRCLYFIFICQFIKIKNILQKQWRKLGILGILACFVYFCFLPLWGNAWIFDWQRLFRQPHAGDIFVPINKGYLFRVASATESVVLCQKVLPEQMSK